jgi:hypothetical protein
MMISVVSALFWINYGGRFGGHWMLSVGGHGCGLLKLRGKNSSPNGNSHFLIGINTKKMLVKKITRCHTNELL